MRSLEPWEMPLEGTALIEASAGTGKTHTLTTLYLRLLVEQDLEPSEILVVTYTQAATAELRERIRARIQQAIRAGESTDEGEEEEDDARALRSLAREARRRPMDERRPDPLRRALRAFDEAAIFTIHGFCQRTLQEHAFESGTAFDAELVEHAEPIQRTLARDLWARLLEGEDPVFVEWLLVGGGRAAFSFDPDSLYASLLVPLGADEEMPILPAPTIAGEIAREEESETVPAASSLEALVVELTQVWARWRDAWRRDHDERIEWLLESKDLNRNRYQSRSIRPTWLPWLESRAASLERVGPEGKSVPLVADLPDWWRRLTPAGVAAGTKKGCDVREDAFFDVCEEVASIAARLAEVLRARAVALRQRFVLEVRSEARRRRESRHELFFDDLLSELRRSLRGPGGARLAELLRERHRFALIDEFQDTDPVQYEIFRRVWHREAPAGGSRGLLLIGDPKQAIYSFRGADVFTYLRAHRDAGEPFSLDVNYRSDPPLIEAVNALFARPAHAFGLEEIGFERVRPRPDARRELAAGERSAAGLRVLLFGKEAVAARTGEAVKRAIPVRSGRTELLQAFARDVADLLESDAMIEGRPLRPSDIAVLCRTRNELARAREALAHLGIPCVDRGDEDVFETREAWELLSVLQAMSRPGDPALLRAALSTAAHGLGASALSSLGDESPELAEISERYADYARLWMRSGFARAFESWRREEGVAERLLALVDGERRLTNWLHLAELLQTMALERGFSRSSLLAWLERAIVDAGARAEIGSEASLLRLESDEQAVSLVTLHRSKGLQYEIVYLPCLWETSSKRGRPTEKEASDERGRRPPVRFHDPASDRRSLDLGGPDYATHAAHSLAEERFEELRLLYVGLTRARRQCTLFWGAIDGIASTPLARLLFGAEAEAEGLDEAGVVAALKGWDEERWREAWESLAEAAGEGAVCVEPANLEPRARWQPERASPAPLHYEPPTSSPPRARITTSFSGLVRGAERASWSGPEAIGRDLDIEVEDELAIASEEPKAVDLAGGMDAFPRGAEAGTLLHEVLEEVDLTAFEEVAVISQASAALVRNGLDPALSESALHVVRSVAHTPFHKPAGDLSEGMRLADLAPGALRSEVEFTLATPGGAAGASGGGFDAASLARLLEAAPHDTPLAGYAPRAACLEWPVLRGYLRGFIDAVFFDGERYFLIDYKSNHLGSRQADYHPLRLVAPMIEHDYVLQYLIYTLALDRHLASTLEGYDYETHFGGVYYLFLRGLALEHARGCGVFFDRPDPGTVGAVSALLGLGGEGRA
jgi:exodeoxyribonuclease V beta subunit